MIAYNAVGHTHTGNYYIIVLGEWDEKTYYGNDNRIGNAPLLKDDTRREIRNEVCAANAFMKNGRRRTTKVEGGRAYSNHVDALVGLFRNQKEVDNYYYLFLPFLYSSKKLNFIGIFQLPNYSFRIKFATPEKPRLNRWRSTRPVLRELWHPPRDGSYTSKIFYFDSQLSNWVIIFCSRIIRVLSAQQWLFYFFTR